MEKIFRESFTSGRRYLQEFRKNIFSGFLLRSAMLARVTQHRINYYFASTRNNTGNNIVYSI